MQITSLEEFKFTLCCCYVNDNCMQILGYAEMNRFSRAPPGPDPDLLILQDHEIDLHLKQTFSFYVLNWSDIQNISLG